MTKPLIAVIAVLLSTHAAFPQLAVGPKVGLNLSWIAMDRGDSETVDILPRRGIQLGWMLNFTLNEHWSAQPELLFTQKGRSIRYTQSSGRPGDFYTRLRSRSNYLEMPLLLKYTFSIKHERWQAFVAAGPSIGYWVSASTRETDDVNGLSSSGKNRIHSFTIEEVVDLTGRVDYGSAIRWETGANLATGVVYQSAVGQFVADIRFNLGITRPIVEKATLGRSFDYNRVLSLAITAFS